MKWKSAVVPVERLMLRAQVRAEEVRGELIGITSVNVLHCDIFRVGGGGL